MGRLILKQKSDVFCRGISRDAPRFYVEPAMDPRIKNAGGHPPALDCPP